MEAYPYPVPAGCQEKAVLLKKGIKHNLPCQLISGHSGACVPPMSVPKGAIHNCEKEGCS